MARGCAELKENNENLRSLKAKLNSLLSDLEQLSRNDGFDLWRKKTSERLKGRIYKKLKKIQNPKNCTNARVLECVLAEAEGLGSTLHHLVHCLVISYHTRRTMILYSNTSYKFDFLEPFSKTCPKFSSKKPRRVWKGFDTKNQIMILDRKTRLLISFKLNQKSIVHHIPTEIVNSITKSSNEPFAWWAGQMIEQFIKISPKILKKMDLSHINLNFSKPIVGIHIRTTDMKKYTETLQISHYMEKVKDFYDQLEITQKIDKRRVFVATDDFDLVETIKKDYPNYEVFANEEAAQIAKLHRNRFKEIGLLGILEDIETLQRCNHVICTFASNVCRLLQELAQAKFPDTFNKIVSLDRLYYTTLNNRRTGIAIQDHTPIYEDEIEIKKGDIYYIRSLQTKNGYYVAQNRQHKFQGLIPAFKIQFNYKVKSNIAY